MLPLATPGGGIDVFGCTCAFCDQLVDLTKANTTLVALGLGIVGPYLWLTRRTRGGGRTISSSR